MRRPKLDQADWHVTLRGARRLLLFHDQQDYRTFYGYLGDACQYSEVGLFADCLMSNHFHLGLSGGTGSLTKCMQRLDRAYSGYHNARYGLTGHAFEQEYFAKPIPSVFILQRVVRYIHLNPFRAGRAVSPEAYPWCGFRRLTSASSDNLGPDEIRVLETFSSDIDLAQREYASFVRQDMKRTVSLPAGKTAASEVWQEQFSWILDHAKKNQDLLLPLEADRVAVHLGSRAGIPPRAMGAVLGHPNGRQVSQMIYRMGEMLSADDSLRKLVDELQVL